MERVAFSIEGEGRFEALTQAVPQLIWWADISGDISYVTPRTLAFFGVPLARLSGRLWIDFVRLEDRPASLDSWNKAVVERAAFEIEHSLRRHDGEDVVHLSTFLPILDGEGNLGGFVRTSTDLSMQKRAEAAVRQVEKLAVAGKLAASIAHEINNPLESITNLLYLLGGNPSLDRTAREYLKLATQELARISEITVQTLRFHKQATMAVPTRMHEVVDSVLSLYKPRISSGGLQLLREYQSTEPLTCWAGEIRQALANIIGNAIDATPEKGKLRVRLGPSRDWKTRQTLGVRITVGDSGKGIQPANRERIFQPFFTTKGLQGTGLGLWITSDLIARRHGTISLRSSVKSSSSGTIISIFLPFEFGGLAEEKPSRISA